ncbi:unnamed protein product [Lactuca saligna]|uniref:Uncharacterized protein n=1 Tax=Lactuca saligna TaxID=75948 RepID=A0AA36DZZ3_LACSI|nr:unnamed protein product [Lactuca saligna]
MNQKIDDFIHSLSNLESVYEAKLDHMQNHVTAQDRYISTLEKSTTELSKASTSSSTSPFQAFSEQVQRQMDSLSSDIAKLSGSTKVDKIAADAQLKAQHNRAMLAEKEMDLIRQLGINDPSLKVPRRKDVHFSKPVIISEPTTQSKLSHSDPNDREKQKIIFKSKKELAKETQMHIDEELAKQLKEKELKSKQEMLRKRNL